MLKRLAFIALAALTLATPAAPQAVVLHLEGVLALTPTSLHAAVYARTKECVLNAGFDVADRSFEEITWFTATEMVQVGFNEPAVAIIGLWIYPHYIYFRSGFEGSPTLISHEVIHDLLQGQGQPGHDPTVFPGCVIG